MAVSSPPVGQSCIVSCSKTVLNRQYGESLKQKASLSVVVWLTRNIATQKPYYYYF